MRLIDLEFVRRVEMSTAESGKDCAEGAMERAPHIGAAYEYIAGGIAAFTGVDSPITQAIGVGLAGAVNAEEFARLEEFYFSRGASVALELSPYIDPTVVEHLSSRPYHIEEFSNVLIRELVPNEEFAIRAAGIELRPARPDEAKLFTQTVSQGFADEFPVTQPLLDVMEGFFHRKGSLALLAFVEGEPAGGATGTIYEGVGGLHGASTLPKFRRCGVQSALLNARLAWLRDNNCEVAMCVTHPGTSSQRNMERAGFRSVYSRVKMVRSGR